MKKIYLKCVYKKNLGDDLLIKTLCDRYPKQKFYVLNTRCGGFNPKPDNLTEIKPNMIIYRICRKISKIINKNNIYEEKIIKKCDYIISIAGSIFMENKNKSDLASNLKIYENQKKPYYIIGSNIGPVYTEQYIENIKEKVIKKAKDVCLRDKKSYNLVKQFDNVRQAPDLVFTLDYNNKNKSEKKVIFSIINIDKKSDQIVNPNKEEYIKKIKELIHFFIKKNYKIELFSFCKNEEGDEQAIEELISNSKYKNKIEKYYYDGNITEALNRLGNSQIIIGSRFHANILGMLMQKTVIPIIYNDKTRELLNDIKFKGKKIDIEQIKDFNVNDITEEDLNYKVNIEKYRKQAEKHFEKLDKILK